jgi:hypothetical protein
MKKLRVESQTLRIKRTHDADLREGGVHGHTLPGLREFGLCLGHEFR